MTILTVLAATLAAQDVGRLLNDLIDLDRLTVVDDAPVRMLSTWDRTGANADGFRPEWVREGVYTLTDAKGPGVVRRFYTARPGGLLRIEVDGAVAVEMPAEEFFSGAREPFLKPLVSPHGGGFYSFFPMPYARTLKITITARGSSDSDFGGYYQLTTQPLPGVESLRLPLSAAQQASWRRVLDEWRDPRYRESRAAQAIDGGHTIPPQGEVTLAALSGSGVIEGLRLRLDREDALRTTRLCIRWDDDETDAVDSPVGDFFGNGFSRVPFRSLLMGLDQEGYYARFPMPFAARARVRLVNESDRPLTVQSRVAWRKTPAPPENTGRFHAKWRRQEMAAIELHERNVTGSDNYRLLDAQGRGRYIGATLNVWNRHLLWWGEGDPMVFVDGDDWPPSIHGTGTEEYFNDAWGFHEAQSPLSATLLA
ncbi:MAG: glycoside hydrolase family 172 protein, partial [Bryobacteraceae bacterium]